MYSASLKATPSDVALLYDSDLRDKKPVISFQTAAEIRYGALKDRWGHRRLESLERRLSAAVTIPPHSDLTTEWAVLRNDCRKAGHAFHDKRHAADLWIAATARLIGVPLITHDSGFRDVPGLDVICHV